MKIITDTLHEDPRTFMVKSRRIPLRMRNFSGRICRESQNTRFTLKIFFSENRAVCEIMWKIIVQPDRPQMTIWRMRIARCIPKATDTQSEYVICNVFPLQQWFHEHAPVLRYTYIACLVGRFHPFIGHEGP